MPEEKKKEKFTFSEKIKDSKTAASKSFANRVSSRIGRDGKPKQTIFERTKRDAPFLIAALVALLLLPFLYKYSGSVKEEAVVTPSSSESIFDPERYAFAPDVENPEGEISQLSARDPLDLIKGWGSSEEKYEASDQDAYDYNEDLYKQRDAYRESEAASAKKSAVDTNVDIEENTTNIYKKRAVAGARHAFKRAATKINPLGKGSAASVGGRPLGVGNWGGALKSAARKVKGDTPKDSPKPVSLQPLQAAGRPARANFGDAAAAMRKAKDALGKHDAERAILDAQVKPVDPGSFGGMTFGDTKFGGGSGKLDRKFSFTPQTPWWWDLMKTRSQMAWQKKFEWKWGIYDWMTKLAENLLGKLLGCLITGSDDWDVDHFLGTAAGTGKAPKCCGIKEKDWPNDYVAKYGQFGKDACNKLKAAGKTSKDFKCDDGWDAGSKAEASMGFFGTRAACLGIAVHGKYKSEDNDLQCQCDDPTFGAFHMKTYGKVSEWVNKKNVYHWVVVRNGTINAGGKSFEICNENSDQLDFNEAQSIGTGSKKEVDHNQAKKGEQKQSYKGEKNHVRTDEHEARPDLANACIIYLAQGTYFDEESMETGIREVLAQKLFNKKYMGAKFEEAELAAIDDAYNQLQFMYIEGAAMAKPLGNKNDMIWASDGRILNGMPIMYKHFYAGYLERENLQLMRRDNVADNKVRAQDEIEICQQGCDYNPLAHFTCLEDSGNAYLSVRTSAKGKLGNIVVTAEFIPASAETGQPVPPYVVEPLQKPENMYVFDDQKLKPSQDDGIIRGQVVWTGSYEYDGVPRTISRHICPITAEGGENISVPPQPTPEPQPEPDPTGEVILAPCIQLVPGKIDDRMPFEDGQVTGKPCDPYRQFFGDSRNVAKEDANHCVEEEIDLMDSTAAKEYVLSVIDAYNEVHKEKPLKRSFRGGPYPTDAEFIDAMYIAKELGKSELAKVPAAAVCELGRDMVRKSQDPHVSTMQNDLGAFLAYVHDESILYPAYWNRSDGGCDRRFLVRGYKHNLGCSPGVPKDEPQGGFRFQYFNYINQPTWAKRMEAFKTIEGDDSTFGSTAIMNERPLKGLTGNMTAEKLSAIAKSYKGVSPFSDVECSSCSNESTKAKELDSMAKVYNSFEGFWGLLRDKNYTDGVKSENEYPWEGKACEEFVAQANVQPLDLDNVLKYVTGVCTAGLNKKPYGLPNQFTGRGSGRSRNNGGNNSRPPNDDNVVPQNNDAQ